MYNKAFVQICAEPGTAVDTSDNRSSSVDHDVSHDTRTPHAFDSLEVSQRGYQRLGRHLREGGGNGRKYTVIYRPIGSDRAAPMAMIVARANA